MNDGWVLHFIAHTHWDREWYLSFQQYRRRLVKMMDRLVDLFEKKPVFRQFTMDGQILAVEDYLEIRPEMEEKIRGLVQGRKLSVGPWYSQPNEFLVSGEALIRNLLLGFRRGERLGGTLNVCYLPDAFGQISQLPQVLRGFGMGELVTWRGMPCGSRTAFLWKGADGSDVHLFYIYGNYGLAAAMPLAEGMDKRIRSIIETLKERATTPHLLFMNGIDHCSAQEDLPEVIQKANETIPGIVSRQSSLSEYIEAVEEAHRNQGTNLQVVKGELRDDREGCILVGSQSTRTQVKKTNCRVESAFERWMEPSSAFCWMLGAPYPEAEIQKAWEYLLQNQAHDSLACSSLDATYHQVMTRFEWAEELGEEIASEKLQGLCNHIGPANSGSGAQRTLAVFNPSSWSRTEVMTARIDVPNALDLRQPRLWDGDAEIPLVVHNARDAVVLKFNPQRGTPDDIPVRRYELSFPATDVPANGYRAYRLTPGDGSRAPRGGLLKTAQSLENESLRVDINPDGTLNVLDKRSGRVHEQLHYFEDSAEAGNGFEHAAPAEDSLFSTACRAARVQVLHDAPFQTTVAVFTKMAIPERLRPDRRGRAGEMVDCFIESRITLSAGVPRVDIETRIDNRAKDHRLRVIFPSRLHASFSSAEQPFDVVQRSVRLPQPSGSALPQPAEHPQLSFVDLSDGGCGLMIANRGIYEYAVSDNAEKAIALTLLRCTDRLYNGPFSECEETRIPEAQCLGEHLFNYSIIPHQGTWENAFQTALDFRYPMRTVLERSLEEETLSGWTDPLKGVSLAPRHSFVRIEPDTLQVTAVKKHESRESLVIRVLNVLESDVKASILVDVPGCRCTAAYRINLKEERQEKLELNGSGRIDVIVKKKGIETFELVKAKGPDPGGETLALSR